VTCGNTLVSVSTPWVTAAEFTEPPIVVPIVAYGQPRAIPGGSVLSTNVAVPSVASPAPDRNPMLKSNQPREEWEDYCARGDGIHSIPRGW
jgi:hypothetical protein